MKVAQTHIVAVQVGEKRSCWGHTLKEKVAGLISLNVECYREREASRMTCRFFP